MKRRGQTTIALAIIIGLIVFLMGIPVVNILKGEVTTARGTDALDCTNSSISDGNRLTCLGVDLVVPYFIWIVISLSISIVIARFVI